jgi:hypothetical protein
VTSRRLSEFISSEVDLIKIDVEGTEEAVMGDLVSTGKLRYAERLHLEYHHHIDCFTSWIHCLPSGGGQLSTAMLSPPDGPGRNLSRHVP